MGVFVKFNDQFKPINRTLKLRKGNKKDQRSTAPPPVSVIQLLNQSANKSVNQLIRY